MVLADSAPSFADALHSSGPASDRAQGMGLYGWLVGSWNMDVIIFDENGAKRSLSGFVSAGWVLEGRAIQDVFAVPELFYGTTLRVYDPERDIWQVRWTDPLNQVYVSMTGRAQGADIVNEGAEPPSLTRLYGAALDGAATIRWTFTDITANSFRWRSERSIDGTAWTLQREYLARRVAARFGSGPE